MKKEEIIDAIMGRYGYKKQELIFVGDAGTDLHAAESRGLYFVGRNTPDNANVFQNVAFKVDDLRQITSVVQSL